MVWGLDVVSSLSLPDFTDSAVINSESSSNCYRCSSAGPDLANLFVGDLQQSMTFADGHVSHVVLMCAYVKMIWVNAKRVVALVANAKAIWNRAISKFPSYSVNAHPFVELAYDADSIREPSKRLPCGPFPNPTSVFAPLYFSIKSFFERRFVLFVRHEANCIMWTPN
jgi:hypothetical protein